MYCLKYYIKVNVCKRSVFLSIGRNKTDRIPIEGTQYHWQRNVSIYSAWMYLSYPTDGEIRIRQKIGQKLHCYQFLYSLGFHPLVLAFLKPCCTAWTNACWVLWIYVFTLLTSLPHLITHKLFFFFLDRMQLWHKLRI